MRNPFIVGIVTGKDFCDRQEEKATLTKHALSGQNVVLFAKRKFGKSSLVKEILSDISNKKMLTIYADLFPVSSEQDLVSILAEAVARAAGAGAIDPRSIMENAKDLFSRIILGVEFKPDGAELSVKFDKKARLELLLEDILQGLSGYVTKNKLNACFVLDEFQEITELPNSKKIEGTLRSFMQQHNNISYFYVGSKRRILLDMFSDKKRPFYKSAFTYSIKEVPKDDFTVYISGKFKKTNKSCDTDVSGMIYDAVEGYPYYVSKLSSLCWDITEKVCDKQVVTEAFAALVKMEALSDFESIWAGLSLGQKALLKAIAKDPTKTLFSKDYLFSHSFSQSSLQRAANALRDKDLIEQDDQGTYRLSDPVFSVWLRLKP